MWMDGPGQSNARIALVHAVMALQPAGKWAFWRRSEASARSTVLHLSDAMPRDICYRTRGDYTLESLHVMLSIPHGNDSLLLRH